MRRISMFIGSIALAAMAALSTPAHAGEVRLDTWRITAVTREGKAFLVDIVNEKGETDFGRSTFRELAAIALSHPDVEDFDGLIGKTLDARVEGASAWYNHLCPEAQLERLALSEMLESVPVALAKGEQPDFLGPTLRYGATTTSKAQIALIRQFWLLVPARVQHLGAQIEQIRYEDVPNAHCDRAKLEMVCFRLTLPGGRVRIGMLSTLKEACTVGVVHFRDPK